MHENLIHVPLVPQTQGRNDIPPHGAGASALRGHRSLGAGVRRSVECLLLGCRRGQSEERQARERGTDVCPHHLVLTWTG